MSKLEKWFPFRFSRKKAEDKKADAKKTESSGVPQTMHMSTPLSRFPTFGPFQQLVQSMFNDPFFREPLARFPEIDHWFGDFSPSRFIPNIDIVDEENALLVTVELPGMSKDDIQMQIENDVLTIHGEKRNVEESKEKGAYRTERYFGYFQRTIPLSGDLDQEKAKAKFAKGVLTVRFPKKPEAKGKVKTIPIKE